MPKRKNDILSWLPTPAAVRRRLDHTRWLVCSLELLLNLSELVHSRKPPEDDRTDRPCREVTHAS